MRTIMISGGNIDRDFALDFLREKQADHLIAVDSGLKFCHEQGIRPDYIVGDFDSLKDGILCFYERDPGIHIKRLIPEKDDSDTECAMHLAMELKSDEIWLLGATGTRIDHLMANLQLLVYASQRKIPMFIADPNNLITVIGSNTVLQKEKQYGRYVSFFSMGDEVIGLTLKGFKYPLTEYHLTNASCGLSLSNEILDDRAEVTFRSGILVMIQSRD